MRCKWLSLRDNERVCVWCGMRIVIIAGIDPHLEDLPDCVPITLKTCLHRVTIDDYPYCMLATQMSEVVEPCLTTAKKCDLCAKEKLQQINRITAALAISHARAHGDSSRVETNYGRYVQGCGGGLGDLVEKALTKVGITKERVEQWIGGPCGCEERKQKLNNLTAWAKRALGMESDAERELRKLLEL